jgi:hypothetical protein
MGKNIDSYRVWKLLRTKTVFWIPARPCVDGRVTAYLSSRSAIMTLSAAAFSTRARLAA